MNRRILVPSGFLLLCLVLLYRPAVKNLISLELYHGWMSDLQRGFTNGDGGVKDFIPDGWQIENWGYSNQQQRLMAEPEHGNVLFMLKTNASGAASIAQIVDMQGTGKAEVKLRYQGGPVDIIVGQIQSGQDQPNPALQARLSLPETETWSDATFDVDLDTTVDRVKLFFATYASGKPVLLDDAFLAHNGQENRLINPRFEADGGTAELMVSPLLKRQESVLVWATDVQKSDPVALLPIQARRYYLAGDLTNLRQTVVALGRLSNNVEKNLGWLIAEGVRQYEQQQYLAAYETFQVVLVADPNQSVALLYLALLYNDLGAYDLAFDIFEKLPLSLNVAFPAGMIALDQKGDMVRARYYFEYIRATSSNSYAMVSNRLRARFEYARGLAQAAQCDLATEQFEILAAIAPTGTDFYEQVMQYNEGKDCP